MEPLRKSHIEIGKIYFWTATISKWIHLLQDDKYKEIIISSLEYLSGKCLVDVFGFVIMPNHIHLILRLNKMNGKEKPTTSLLKYTAHEFRKMKNTHVRKQFAVDASNKQFEFWQRDSLAVELYSSLALVRVLTNLPLYHLQERKLTFHCNGTA